MTHFYEHTFVLFFFFFQDDRSTVGLFNSIVATLEVYSLPAEALEGVQTRAGCSQEVCCKTTPKATKKRFT